ncbi:unnamed protein product [Soboliphyme baturini]|uniref:Mediator of RNA polymerase II transcription subunit 30 n=1 Tax=Soboliphyme baturini TaxID=241478 RepID=A0A183IE55_9BILA|nr:unnamed protein product [Soboliphyme baturini]
MSSSNPFILNCNTQENPGQVPSTPKTEQSVAPDVGRHGPMQGLPSLIPQEIYPLAANLRPVLPRGVSDREIVRPMNPAMAQRNVAPEDGHQQGGNDMWPSTQSKSSPHSQLFIGSVYHAVQNIDQYGPLTLCLLGRDLTREIVNRTVDLFSHIKTLQLPLSTETFKQQQEKQLRAQESLKHIVYLFNRLESIGKKLEQFQRIILPENVDNMVTDLIPLVDKPNKTLDEIRQATTSRESYQKLLNAFEETRAKLQEKRDILFENIEFFRQISWEIAALLE